MSDLVIVMVAMTVKRTLSLKCEREKEVRKCGGKSAHVLSSYLVADSQPHEGAKPFLEYWWRLLRPCYVTQRLSAICMSYLLARRERHASVGSYT